MMHGIRFFWLSDCCTYIGDMDVLYLYTSISKRSRDTYDVSMVRNKYVNLY